MRPRRVIRKTCQLSAKFTALTMLNTTDGEGYTLDVSGKGCRIESDAPIDVGKCMSLRIDLVATSGYRARIHIEAARVRWVREHNFGVEFLKVTPGNQQLLMKYVHEMDQKWATSKPMPVLKSAEDD